MSLLVPIMACAIFINPQRSLTLQPTTRIATTPAHVSNSFRFTLSASLDKVAPFFGAEGERCWAGKNWDPEFLYPQPTRDIQGAVFTVQHGTHKSIWVNTVFDLAGGRMQYVAVIPDVVASVIDVRLTAVTADQTAAEVTYNRTALDSAANGDVIALGESDRSSGSEWRQAIQACMAAQHN